MCYNRCKSDPLFQNNLDNANIHMYAIMKRLAWEKGDMDMQITDVRVRKVEKEGKLKAVVSITLDDEFVVHDIKVIEGEKGLFIAMPSKKAADGEYRDIAHPINSGTRERIQRIILERYEHGLENETENVMEEL